MDARSRAQATAALLRLADGDRAAFRPVFDLLWPAIRSFARRLIPDDALAEDVAQRALMKVFEQASGFQAEGDALTWALTLAAWECKTARRKAGRRREHAGGDAALGALASPAAGPEEAALQRDLEMALADALEGLSVADQAVLRQLLEDAAPEGPADPTQRKRKQRALERLRAAWRAIHGDV